MSCIVWGVLRVPLMKNSWGGLPHLVPVFHLIETYGFWEMWNPLCRVIPIKSFYKEAYKIAGFHMACHSIGNPSSDHFPALTSHSLPLNTTPRYFSVSSSSIPSLYLSSPFPPADPFKFSGFYRHSKSNTPM